MGGLIFYSNRHQLGDDLRCCNSLLLAASNDTIGHYVNAQRYIRSTAVYERVWYIPSAAIRPIHRNNHLQIAQIFTDANRKSVQSVVRLNFGVA